MWPFTSRREKRLKERADLKRVQPRKRTPYKWVYDNTNPTTLALLKSGHGISLENRYMLNGDNVKDTITLVDIETMDICVEYPGITRSNLNASIEKVKELKECLKNQNS